MNQLNLTPPYSHNIHHEYIFLTSLNLGGAEKIVADQLWANYYSKFPTQYTLIVLYDKEKEHSLPPNIHTVRLNGNIEKGELLFTQLAFLNKSLVVHLINDKIANYLFSLGLYIHLVIHNDKRAWPVNSDTLNHPQLISIISICKFVTKQLQEVSTKPIITLRHQIKYYDYLFNQSYREKIRHELNIQHSDIVLGMVGRICEQKNYPLAIDALFHLTKNNPTKSYKLIIAGGFEKSYHHIYLSILQKINYYKLHDRVLLLGFRKDISELINAFDIALNTSYFEGLSMATQELMSNGLPIVLTHVCGQPEIFDELQQLHFFELPHECNNPITIQHNYDNAPIQYKEMIHTISNTISSIPLERTHFSDEHLKTIARLCYGSHRIWSLINHIKPSPKKNNTIFITSNLNLGGAQRSLINLLCYIQTHKNDLNCVNFNPQLVLINQSNQNSFFNELYENSIPYYLCHSSKDVFDICKNLLEHIFKEQINQIVFWNAESKIKTLLTKLLPSSIKIIDVSPGDYIFNEINNEKTFQDSIYFSAPEYFSRLTHFVSKFNIQKPHPLTQYLNTTITTIPNGVFFDPSYVKKSYFSKEYNKPFSFLVCGRIAPSKHLEIIFESFIKFCSTYHKSNSSQNFSLNIVGDFDSAYEEYYDNLRDKYISHINNEQYPIHFVGFHPEPQEIMKNYDCIIVLGTHQGSPNIILEAATCQIPIIANDSGGTKEIIDNDTGHLISPIPSVDSLYPSMINMFDNYEQSIKKAMLCFNKTKKNFSMYKMATSYLSLFGENK